MQAQEPSGEKIGDRHASAVPGRAGDPHPRHPAEWGLVDRQSGLARMHAHAPPGRRGPV